MRLSWAQRHSSEGARGPARPGRRVQKPNQTLSLCCLCNNPAVGTEYGLRRGAFPSVRHERSYAQLRHWFGLTILGTYGDGTAPRIIPSDAYCRSINQAVFPLRGTRPLGLLATELPLIHTAGENLRTFDEESELKRPLRNLITLPEGNPKMDGWIVIFREKT